MTVYPDPRELRQPKKIVTAPDLKLPYGIAFNSCGEMIVTQCNDNQKLTSIMDQTIKDISEVEIAFPKGIAVDDTDNIYVSSEHKLQKFTSSGELMGCVGQLGSREKEFRDPRGIALYNDEVYICDRKNHQIQVFDQYLKFIRLIGTYGKGRGEFDTPKDIEFDADGAMYIADFGNSRLQVLDTQGHFIRMIGKEKLHQPIGLHIVDKHVYVSDYDTGSIEVFETSGEFVVSLGMSGVEEEKFYHPRCIASLADKIYICDYGNNTIQIF